MVEPEVTRASNDLGVCSIFERKALIDVNAHLSRSTTSNSSFTETSSASRRMRHTDFRKNMNLLLF
jgi:hypothetical protein